MRILGPSVMLAVVVLAAAAHAQTGGALPAVAPVAEQHWASVRCEACQKAGISFEFRQLPNQSRDAVGFIVARVRNLGQREVAGSIEVMEADLPDSEGHISSQTLWFVLGPAGKDGGEQVVLLRRSTPVEVIVHGVAQQ